MNVKLIAGAIAGLAAAASLLAGQVVATEASKPDPWLRPAAVPAPADNVPNADRVELGRALFFDPRLSGSGMISCATCHNPSLGWADGQPTAIGHMSKRLGRATPTIVNSAYNTIQMWDGRKATLEDQALGPIGDPNEMALPIPQMVERVSAIEGYRVMFDRAYPGQGVSAETVAKAIASFERTVVSSTSPFDRWRAGEATAVSDAAKRGFEVFNGKGNCAACHQGFNFTDNGFHNIGIKAEGDAEGRFAHRRVKVLKGAFKTPTLREIALTAPYMRNGMYATLDEVVDHYDRGGDDLSNLSPNMKPLGLTAGEKADLVAFMQTLTGAPVAIVVPQLPPGPVTATTASR
jgi:cytochrome c peroxidase